LIKQSINAISNNNIETTNFNIWYYPSLNNIDALVAVLAVLSSPSNEHGSFYHEKKSDCKRFRKINENK
jgi:hypothetical protein